MTNPKVKLVFIYSIGMHKNPLTYWFNLKTTTLNKQALEWTIQMHRTIQNCMHEDIATSME